MKLLERHRARRKQSLPTISCFIGSIDEARAAFAAEGPIIEVGSGLIEPRPLLGFALAIAARASVPAEAWPGLFVAEPDEGALIELAQRVEEHPFLRVGVVVDQAQLDRAPPRVAALLREGLILLLDERRERARAEVLGAKEPDRAKSAAERFLHEVLQSMADTRDVFALNARMDFVFGPAPAEIDLAAVSQRIAIEIDGYFHFQDADAYRRDRRKDLLLQTRGWWVLRFLAEDVVVRLEETLTTIRHALDLRSGGFES